MGKRHPNPRRAKRHRTYTIEELATLFQLHKNTVRRWPMQGLHPIDSRRPALFRGEDVAAFLATKRQSSRRPCKAGEIYCLKCRTPRAPEGGFADLYIQGPTNGTLVGICPVCATMLYRRVNPARIALVRGNLEVRVRQAPTHIEDWRDPIANSDLRRQGST
jgi:hypothetical protein